MALHMWKEPSALVQVSGALGSADSSCKAEGQGGQEWALFITA